MKFGRTVKFVVENEALTEFDLSADVNQLSELVDRINDKSNTVFLSDLLSSIQSSLNPKQS